MTEIVIHHDVNYHMRSLYFGIFLFVFYGYGCCAIINDNCKSISTVYASNSFSTVLIMTTSAICARVILTTLFSHLENFMRLFVCVVIKLNLKL